MGIDISNLVLVLLLSVASVQDFLKKSVSDIIHYLLLVFAFSIAIYNLLTGNVNNNYFYSYFILLFFFLMYLFKFLAIGDLYIMFSLFFFLSNLNFQQILVFFIMLAIFGAVFHSMEAIKIFYKNKEIKNVFFVTIAMLLSILAGIFFSITFKNMIENYNLFLMSSFFLLISTIILKTYEEKIKKELTFERSIDELVEGDWVENEIKIRNIPEELLEEINKNFVLEKKENLYTIKLKNYNNKRKFMILLLIIIPFVFYNNIRLFLVSVISIILLLTLIHDKIFKDDLGLSKKQIELLKKIVDKDTKFIVKEGAPFVPAITFAYIFSII
ncbi:MAG: hypothetical protein QW184_01630 [Nanopusillaceae archaeon]